jgi:hypothetical protein
MGSVIFIGMTGYQIDLPTVHSVAIVSALPPPVTSNPEAYLRACRSDVLSLAFIPIVRDSF